MRELGFVLVLGAGWTLGSGCSDEPRGQSNASGGSVSGGTAPTGGRGDAGAGEGPGDGGTTNGGTASGGESGAAGSGFGEGGEAGSYGGEPNAGSSAGGTGPDPGGMGGEAGDSEPLYHWSLPKGFPTPVVPPENPMSDAKVLLGRHLFYDKRLSGNETQACASCHRQELGFTDGGMVSLGSTGQAHPRNSMTLANVGYVSTLTWANPLLFELEDQALVPMFGTDPVELGLNGRESELIERLRAVPRYEELFAAAHPGAPDPFTLANIVGALASFQRALLSGNSPFDRYTYHGEKDALSESAKRGRVLFNSEKLECFHCHSGFNLQDSVHFVGRQFRETPFHNTALYNVDGAGAYPAPNTGIYDVTGRAADMGRFRVPTLRNIAVTAPYMHDGSIATLDEVLDHYAAGGRTIPSGPHAGVGSANPLKSPFMVGFTLTPEERADVLAFFESLTDHGFLTDPRFSDPWPAP
jgi:cytochrome c peroxidase